MSSDEFSARPPWMPPSEDADSAPTWDNDEADWLIGKYALVGITYLTADGETVVSQAQFHGRIQSVDQSAGISINCEGARAGQTMTLPPHLSAFQIANSGEYKLRATDETVKDPDVIATWSIASPSKS